MNTLARSAAAITYTTWKALFLREAVVRLAAGRTAWLWVLLEPAIHIVFMLFIFTAVRMRTVGGMDALIWLMVGMLAFFMFRRTAIQAMNAVDANRPLFTYRQVKPIDTVLVRAGLEGFLMVLVSAILFAGAALSNRAVMPADPLSVLEAMAGLWILGTGFGLIASVASDLVPELGKLLGLSMMPLYFISGVMLPVTAVPLPYREWLMLNPVAHGLEAARSGFSPYYHHAPELSIAYLYGCGLIALFAGLALHARFSTRLIAQ